MRTRLLGFLAAATVALAVLAVTSTAGAVTAPVFGEEATMPNSGPGKTGTRGGSEPSLAISPQGVRYPSWQSPGHFAVSPDGVHFYDAGVPDPDAAGDVTNAIDRAGWIYNGQICGGTTILHTCIYRKKPGGAWQTRNTLADNHPGASDRPWIDVYPDPADKFNPNKDTVYLEYHTFSPEDLVYVTVSHDGGATFSPPNVLSKDPIALTSSFCNTIPSGVVVDQNTGYVYALWLAGNDLVSNVNTGCNYSQLGPFNRAYVSVSKDRGATWTSHPVWQGAFDAITKKGDNADKIFGTITVDFRGQVHVALPVRHNDDTLTLATTQTETASPTDLYLFTSPDRGDHWTPAFKLNKLTGSYFFPWAAGGSFGRVAVIYYRTTSLLPNATTDRWNIALSSVAGATARVDNGKAHYTQTPSVSEVLVDEDAEHIGGICTFGVFCAAVPNANRNLADSISLAVDPSGGLNAVWTDDHAVTGPSDTRNRVIKFACQVGGSSMYSWLPALTSCFKAR